MRIVSIASTALLGIALAGCDSSSPGPSASSQTTAASARTALAQPAPRPPVMSSGRVEDTLTYAPIDVAKLDEQWWRQYSGQDAK